MMNNPGWLRELHHGQPRQRVHCHPGRSWGQGRDAGGAEGGAWAREMWTWARRVGRRGARAACGACTKAMDKGGGPWSWGRGSSATGGWATGGAAAKTGSAAGYCARDRGGVGASGVAWDRGDAGAADAGGARPRRDVRAKGAGGMAVDDGARGCAIGLLS